MNPYSLANPARHYSAKMTAPPRERCLPLPPNPESWQDAPGLRAGGVTDHSPALPVLHLPQRGYGFQPRVGPQRGTTLGNCAEIGATPKGL